MAGLADALQSFSRFLAAPSRPNRVIGKRRVRLFAAAASGMVGGLALLLAYYLTLGLLPSAFAYPLTDYPVADWASRMDLAQFAGTLLLPPTPTALTWWVGLAVSFGTLTALGVVYAALLTWSLQKSSWVYGVSFGLALFIGLGMTLTIANGLHPAILRNALPDTGLFLLGWSPLATIQLLSVYLLYGAIVAVLYERLSR